jgi:oligoribonuclease
MDLEMTGLDPDHDQILEIAVLVSDGQLTTLVEGPDLVIHQASNVLHAMDEWNTDHHGASGLTQASLDSKIDYEAAERATLEFLRPLCEAGQAPLAGNSVHQDRAFLRRCMPTLHQYLHYRNVDVSTVKELVRRWSPPLMKSAPQKSERHRAMADIHDSIAELRYYRAKAFDSGLQIPDSGDGAETP